MWKEIIVYQAGDAVNFKQTVSHLTFHFIMKRREKKTYAYIGMIDIEWKC